jgi:hypothetical protein
MLCPYSLKGLKSTTYKTIILLVVMLDFETKSLRLKKECWLIVFIG